MAKQDRLGDSDCIVDGGFADVVKASLLALVSHWLLCPEPYGGHRGVWFFWDEATGEAIVHDGEDLIG